MPPDPDDDVLTDFRDAVIQPLCVEFASRIGAEEPRKFDEEDRVGTVIRLPRSFRTDEWQRFIVRLEPFDEESFVVKTTRPDQLDEANDLRQVALVGYEVHAESTENARASLNTAFEQIRQYVSRERTM